MLAAREPLYARADLAVDTSALGVAEAAERIVIRPMRSLWLLSIAHAVNHAQAVLLPLIRR